MTLELKIVLCQQMEEMEGTYIHTYIDTYKVRESTLKNMVCNKKTQSK